MARRKGTRIYGRSRGGVVRYYADFRDFADVGGGREALCEPGRKRATTDPDIAADLAAVRLKRLEAARRGRVVLGVDRDVGLIAFSAYHLKQKSHSGRVTVRWIAETQLRLEVAIEFFCNGARPLDRDPITREANLRAITDRPLSAIGVRDVQRYANWLTTRPNGRGGTFSAKTQLEYLLAVSNLYRRAQAEGAVPPGFNPVAAMIDKPRPARHEARWLEVSDAALLLESARRYKPKPSDFEAIPPAMLRAIVATFLLTGGRKAEVLGLMVEDLSFDRRTVTFRPHPHRRLKTSTSLRTVPMWPQLEEILREHVFGGDAPRSGLLFPSVRSDGMIHDLRKALDAIATRAGWKAGDIRTKAFRHTYCAARLQTLDQGAPVSVFTVSRELGHGGEQLVKRVYGHLGEVRHRSNVVEYRVEQHRKALGDRLRRLTRGAALPAKGVA